MALVLLVIGSAGCSSSASSQPQTLPPLVPLTSIEDAGSLVPVGPPVLTLVDGSSFWCPITFDPVPLLAVYGNGVALRAENNGSHCDVVPRVWAVRLDLDVLRTRLDRYLASPEGMVDLMARIPADSVTSTITYRQSDGTVRSRQTPERGTGGAPGDSEPTVAGHRAFDRLWEELVDVVPERTEHPVTELAVGVSPEIGHQWPAAEAPLPIWPLTAPPWDDPTGRSCAQVSGEDAAAVLTASDPFPSLQTWDLGGTSMVLSIEVVLPGTGAGCPI